MMDGHSGDLAVQVAEELIDVQRNCFPKGCPVGLRVPMTMSASFVLLDGCSGWPMRRSTEPSGEDPSSPSWQAEVWHRKPPPMWHLETRHGRRVTQRTGHGLAWAAWRRRPSTSSEQGTRRQQSRHRGRRSCLRRRQRTRESRIAWKRSPRRSASWSMPLAGGCR